MARGNKNDTSEITALAEALGRELVVEDFGFYLTGPGAADDTELGRTVESAKVVLARMLEKKRRSEAVRAKSR